MPDEALVNRNSITAPKDYDVPGAQEFILRAVSAALDGSASTGSWQPALQLISPAGDVMWTAVLPTVAAAGSANVSWFPGGDVEPAAAGTGSGVIVESFFLTTTSTGVTSSTVLQTGRQYVVTVQGTYSLWNLALNVGSPNADAMFPSGGVRASTQVGLDAETLFAYPSGGMPDTIGHIAIFQMNLGSGYQHVEPVGGPFSTPQKNYFYTYNVTGQGSTVSFRIDDSPLTDNYGKLLITIQTVGGSSGGGGGGSLLPDPSQQPNGAWLRTSNGTAVWQATPQVTETDMSLSDVTTQNVSTSKHGFAPKAPNDVTKFLDGTGAYSVPPGSSPLTTKGDVFGFSTVNARIPVGSNNQVLTADSAQTLGLKWAGAVNSVDSITGAVSLVAGANVTISDNSPGAGQITIAATPGAGGFSVVDYAEFTSNVSITATTEGTAQSVVSGAGFTADGTSHYLVEFFSPSSHPDTGAAGRSLVFVMLDGATVIGQSSVTTPASSTDNVPINFRRRLVPSAASHTFAVKAFVSAGTGVIGASTGGAGNALPGFIMVTKQI